MNPKQHVWGWRRWTELKKEIWKFVAVYYGWSHGGEYTGSNRSYLMKMRFMDRTLSNSDIYMAPKKTKKKTCWKIMAWVVGSQQNGVSWKASFQFQLRHTEPLEVLLILIKSWTNKILVTFLEPRRKLNLQGESSLQNQESLINPKSDSSQDLLTWSRRHWMP